MDDPTATPAADSPPLTPAAYDAALTELATTLRTSDPAAAAQEVTARAEAEAYREATVSTSLAVVGAVLTGRHALVPDLLHDLVDGHGYRALGQTATQMALRWSGMFPHGITDPASTIPIRVSPAQLAALPAPDRFLWESGAVAATHVLSGAVMGNAARLANGVHQVCRSWQIGAPALCLLAQHLADMIEQAQDLAGTAMDAVDALRPVDPQAATPPRDAVFPALG
jgi:hypothetical protein